MKKLLLSGSSGFIGSNIRKHFESKLRISTFDINTTSEDLLRLVQESDIIIHASGVSRSESEEDFFKINFHLVSRLSIILESYNDKKVIFFRPYIIIPTVYMAGVKDMGNIFLKI